MTALVVSKSSEMVIWEPPVSARGLDTDPDTSLVESLQLHLLSEHGISDAHRLSEKEAVAKHRRLHANGIHHHGITDLRFRPYLGLKVLTRAWDLHEALGRIQTTRS